MFKVTIYLINQRVCKDIIVGRKLRQGQTVLLRTFSLGIGLSRHDVCSSTQYCILQKKGKGRSAGTEHGNDRGVERR